MRDINLLDELKICSKAINGLKGNYLEQFLKKEYSTKSIYDLMTGQYIAYASCHSILMDLIDKYEKEEIKH